MATMIERLVVAVLVLLGVDLDGHEDQVLLAVLVIGTVLELAGKQRRGSAKVEAVARACAVERPHDDAKLIAALKRAGIDVDAVERRRLGG
jgi:hypothetical protein